MSTPDAVMREIGREIGAWQTAVQRFDELAAARMGLHVTDLQILGLLSSAGPLPAGKLAGAAGLSPGATTAAVDRLEQAGYVRRSRGTADRRRVVVGLTARARRLNEEIWGPIVREGMDKLRGYRPKELAMLRDFVRWCRELQSRHIERVAPRTPR